MSESEVQQGEPKEPREKVQKGFRPRVDNELKLARRALGTDASATPDHAQASIHLQQAIIYALLDISEALRAQ